MNDEAPMTNDETILCGRSLLSDPGTAVAGESGVAATALPPQSKFAAGRHWFLENIKITKQTHLRNATIG
jgi:hypothetical protein